MATDWAPALSALKASKLSSPPRARKICRGASGLANSWWAPSTSRSRRREVRSRRIRVLAAAASMRWKPGVEPAATSANLADAPSARFITIDPDAGRGRAVIGTVEAPPVVIEDARILFGGGIGPSFVSRFDAAAADAALVAAGMSDPVDRHVHVTVLRRAIVQASGQGPAKVQAAA